MCLNRISEWKVMTISISRELPLFNFVRLDILCPRIGHLCEILWPFEYLESFRCSIWSVSIYYASESDIRVKSYNHLNFLRASLFIFERLDKLWVSHMPPSQNLWPLEFVERFLVQFLVSQYIMRLNHTSEWKVMIIWISLELSLFIF